MVERESVALLTTVRFGLGTPKIMANIVGDQAVMLAYRIFRHLRLEVRYDSQMMDLTVVSSMIRRELPTKEQELELWLSHVDKE